MTFTYTTQMEWMLSRARTVPVTAPGELSGADIEEIILRHSVTNSAVAPLLPSFGNINDHLQSARKSSTSLVSDNHTVSGEVDWLVGRPKLVEPEAPSKTPLPPSAQCSDQADQIKISRLPKKKIEQKIEDKEVKAEGPELPTPAPQRHSELVPRRQQGVRFNLLDAYPKLRGPGMGYIEKFREHFPKLVIDLEHPFGREREMPVEITVEFKRGVDGGVPCNRSIMDAVIRGLRRYADRYPVQVGNLPLLTIYYDANRASFHPPQRGNGVDAGNVPMNKVPLIQGSQDASRMNAREDMSDVNVESGVKLRKPSVDHQGPDKSIDTAVERSEANEGEHPGGTASSVKKSAALDQGMEGSGRGVQDGSADGSHSKDHEMYDVDGGGGASAGNRGQTRPGPAFRNVGHGRNFGRHERKRGRR